jgi:RNA polymerase sigma factor (sigma-70 family)
MGNASAFVPNLPQRAAEAKAIADWDPDVRRASLAMARRVRGCRADADDFSQEARLRLLAVHRARGAMSEGYGRRVLRNAVVSAARPVFRHREQHANDVDAETVEDALEEEGHGPHEHAARLIDGLPRRFRRVYELLFVRDLTQREVARKLRVTQPRITQLRRELLERARALFIAA